MQFLVFAAVLATATAKEWTIDDRAKATILVGIGSQHKSDAHSVLPVGQNGVGNFANVYDFTSDSYTKSDNVNMMMVLDASLTQSGNTMLLTGMGNALSTDGGKTFEKDPELLGVSQAAYSFGNDGETLGVVGTMTLKSDKSNTDGVASTSNAGKSWTLSASVPEGMPRYGAFPSETTWFVSQGMWNTEEAVDVSEEGRYHTLGVHVKKDKKSGNIKFTQSPRKWPTNVKDDVNATGWWGAVSKTEDGGKTWKQVLRTDDSDYLYFNQISCGTTDNCIVVGEGTMPDGTDLTRVYTTFDGGKSWTKSVPGATDVSMMSVKFTSENEAWVGSAASQGRNVVGNFYKTTDGGKSFKLEQALTNCYPMDIDFGVELGTAACISSSGQSASAAFYK